MSAGGRRGLQANLLAEQVDRIGAEVALGAMHLWHAHQLGAVLAQALLHQGQAGPIAEHVAGGPQQGQQAAAHVRGGRHQQQFVAAHRVEITSAARRMPGLMLTRPTQLPGRSSLSMASSWRKSLRSTATARTLCFLASSSTG